MARLDFSDSEAANPRLVMSRGVTQLLFNYLPERTVDWEDGLAIVRLGEVFLKDVWTAERARIVLDEVGNLLERWQGQHGVVDPQFPDPRFHAGRFSVGTPEAIQATLLQTAYVCQRCNALMFFTRSQLARGTGPLRCSQCNASAVRQFGQVFVHGCGELVPLQRFIPGARVNDEGRMETFQRPIRCSQCGDHAPLEITAHSERVSDMKVVCKRCHTVVVERMTARCPRCTARIAQEDPDMDAAEGTWVARVAMRLSRYSANDTYYPQTMTLLRLDRPLIAAEDPEQQELRSFLPADATPVGEYNPGAAVAAIADRLRRAIESGDEEEKLRLLGVMNDVATGSLPTESSASATDQFPELSPDLVKAVQESLAFRTTVTTRPALTLARQGQRVPDHGRRLSDLQSQLGFREIGLVDDLPVITATFGYTRRTWEPTYTELNTRVATEIRVFPSMGTLSANKLGRPEIAGTIPVLAREGQHQGIFISLNPERVVDWLASNDAPLPHGPSSRARILSVLEPVDRYYDDIWDAPYRRLVFGLLHTLSHVVMRATSWFSGLERTSLSEYLFLPLLGTVVFDTSGAFQLGGIESLVRDHLGTFLEQLPYEAVSCIYDTDCIDGRGACHGCVHSPEIACRVFNHGLSRAFLLGGHVPWLDMSDERQVVGYWQEDS